jgi:predicted NAD/FAD-binding protein
MEIAVVGTGIAGLVAGWLLSNDGHQVTIYEALPEVGIQAHTMKFLDQRLSVDVPLRTFSPHCWPNLNALCNMLDVPTNKVNLSQSYFNYYGKTLFNYDNVVLGEAYLSNWKNINTQTTQIIKGATQF